MKNRILVDNNDPPLFNVTNEVGNNKEVEPEQLVEVSIKKIS